MILILYEDILKAFLQELLSEEKKIFLQVLK